MKGKEKRKHQVSGETNTCFLTPAFFAKALSIHTRLRKWHKEQAGLLTCNIFADLPL